MPDNLWFYAKNAQQLGPVNEEQLKFLATRGQLLQSDLVWQEGMPQWVPAHTVPGLFQTATMAQVPGYPQQPTVLEYAPAGEDFNQKAMIGMILSIVGLVMCPPVGIGGLVVSWKALSGMNRTGNSNGRGMAIAGIVIGSLGLLGVLFYIAIIILAVVFG